MFKKIIIVSTLVLTSLTTVTSVLSTRAEAQAVKSNKTTQLSVVLKKVNKDSSRVYTVNGQEVIVTKAQLDEVAKVIKDNNIKEDNVKLGKGSALQFAGLAAMVSWMMQQVGIWGAFAFMYIVKFCSPNPRGCAMVAQGLWQGQGWARDQVRRWSQNRN